MAKNWSKKMYREYMNTGGGLDYYVTIFNNGRKQVEIFEDLKLSDKTYRKIRSGDILLNIGILDVGTQWDDWIQGNYIETRKFSSFKEALKYAQQYMRQ